MPHRASSSWSVASSVPPSPASFVVGGVCRLVTIRLASVRTTRKYSDIATAMNGETVKSDTQLSNSRATVREASRACATVGLNDREGRRAGRWREHGGDEGAGGFAREPRTCAVLSRGRQTAHRENRVLLKTAWRGITSRERIGRGCGKERGRGSPRGTVAGQRRVRAPGRAARCPTRVHTGGPTAGIAQPGRRVHAPPGEQFVERGVLRAPIPRFIRRRRRLPARHNPAGQRPHDPQVLGYRYGDEWRI